MWGEGVGGGGGGGGVNLQHTSLPKKKQHYTYFDPLLGCVMFTWSFKSMLAVAPSLTVTFRILTAPVNWITCVAGVPETLIIILVILHAQGLQSQTEKSIAMTYATKLTGKYNNKLKGTISTDELTFLK